MNKYKTLEVIGEGAYGIVLKCKNKRSGQIYAIKKFKDSEASGNSANRRELKLLRTLEHENIVKIEDAFIRKGKLCIVFEYMNKSLLQVIEEVKHGLPLEKIKLYSYQLCQAINYCHCKDIIHRDIKPENLLINENDNLKLCDFGFARNLVRPPDKLTEYVATRWYRAPELLLGGCYGKPVDIWSIGCIVGEMGDGEALFPGNSEIDQLYLIQKILGPLPPVMVKNFSKNQRFAGSNCPTSEVTTSLERRYKGVLNCCFILFMKETLCLEPEHRPTAEDCLKHVAFKLDLNCNSSNSNKNPSTRANKSMKTSHNCVLPPVKISDSSENIINDIDPHGPRNNDIISYKPRKLTCRVESDVLNKRIINNPFTEVSIHSSDTINKLNKHIEIREFLPNLPTESTNNNNNNLDMNRSINRSINLHASNDRSFVIPKKTASPFKKCKSRTSHKAASDPSVLCTIMKNKNSLFKLPGQVHRNLSKQNINCNHNGSIVNNGNAINGKQSSPLSSFSLEVKQMEMLKGRKKFRKLNKVGVLRDNAIFTTEGNVLSDDMIGPRVTPNYDEMFEVPDIKFMNANCLNLDPNHNLKTNIKITKSYNKCSKSNFRLKPIKSNNYNCSTIIPTPSMIPISSDSKIIHSSSYTMPGGHGNCPEKINNNNSNITPTISKSKKRNSAIFKKLLGKSRFKRVSKLSENIPALTTVSCISRIPIAIRMKQQEAQDVLTFKHPKCKLIKNTKKSPVRNLSKGIKGRQPSCTCQCSKERVA